MSAYAEVSVVVDGALEQNLTFHDATLMTAEIAEIVEEAKGDGYRTEVFVMFHEHNETEDCECVQFEASHLPEVTINSDTDGEWETY